MFPFYAIIIQGPKAQTQNLDVRKRGGAFRELMYHYIAWKMIGSKLLRRIF